MKIKHCPECAGRGVNFGCLITNKDSGHVENATTVSCEKCNGTGHVIEE